MPIFITKKDQPKQATVIVKKPGMGVSKVQVNSSAPLTQPEISKKMGVQINKNAVPQKDIVSKDVSPPAGERNGTKVVITHDFPKDYKVCKKGDTGVIVKGLNNMVKVQLDNPKTDTRDTWMYNNQVAELG